ncbi:MAG: NAD(P)H-dependent oxidoreductase subunit E [Actinomycetota bacterium]
MSAYAPGSAEAVRSVLATLPPDERLILPALQHLQEAFGHVPEGSVDAVADELNVSKAEVVGVLTYYHDLRETPPPAVVVQVCVAEACQAQGVRDLLRGIEGEYAVAVGRRTLVGDVEFDKVYCLGNCALGPAVMVNGQLVGRCDTRRLRTAIEAAR